MITAIVSNVRELEVRVSFDAVLRKYCLLVCTNEGMVEMVLRADQLVELAAQLQGLAKKLVSSEPGRNSGDTIPHS